MACFWVQLLKCFLKPLVRNRSWLSRLTQLSKQLHSQSCVDEEQQHEEQTEVSHLSDTKEHLHVTQTDDTHINLCCIKSCVLLHLGTVGPIL